MVSATPPSLLGKQSKSDNIRFTVGQYWLIIKKKDKFCQFCEKLCYFVISGKLCLEKFWYVRKIFGPLKWYTDRNFSGDGGGWEEGASSKIIFSGKNFWALKAPTTSRFLIIWTWQLCTMAIRSLHGLSANFTLTPPLFNPPRYGPADNCIEKPWKNSTL
jgi:hypothetical protein